jgi:Uma2 family endonuclease
MAMPIRMDEVTTIEQLLALPEDGRRHELLDGVHVVTPSPMPPHQLVLGAFWGAVLDVVRRNDRLRALSSPADIRLGPRTLVQPDLFVFRQEPGHRVRDWSEIGVPILAIEFLSPSTATRDRGVKRKIYQRAGVAEYWVVDHEARLVERWRPLDTRPDVLHERLVWAPAELAVPLELDLPALFDEALGPDDAVEG